MVLVKVKQLAKQWDGMPLFKGVSFDIIEGDRIALIGRNGIGKTTLLQCLLGRIQADAGEVQTFLPVEEWGVLDQHLQIDFAQLTIDVVQWISSRSLYELRRKIAQLEHRLQYEADEEQVLSQYGTLVERYMAHSGYDWEVEIEKSLQQLDIDESLWTMPFERLSGGQKTRAQLAAIMAKKPQLIVLDEPTNHLDADVLQWLEKWIQQYKGTVLYVSHDRAWIDHTATHVLELRADGCKRYTGGYSDHRVQKEIEWRTQETLYQKQQQEEKKLLESIQRYATWFNKSHRAAGQHDFYRSKAKKNVSRMRAKEAALERLEQNKVKKPQEEAKLNVQLQAEANEAATFVRIENLHFSYAGQRELFGGLSLAIGRGERLGVIGANGTGKSTFLKLLCGQLQPESGSIYHNPQTRIGYLSQELDHLNEDITILDSLLSLPDMTQTEARTILGCFLFSRDDVFKKIHSLSMGEKCRVAFIKLYFGRNNLLVLDEPTNYLDIDTRERIEEALFHYPGSIVFVSHDRYFIRKVANRLLILHHDDRPQCYEGNYDEYEAMKQRGRRLLNTEEQSRENERIQLEMRLAQLIAEPESDDEIEREKVFNEIRTIQKRLKRLEDSCDERA